MTEPSHPAMNIDGDEEGDSQSTEDIIDKVLRDDAMPEEERKLVKGSLAKTFNDNKNGENPADVTQLTRWLKGAYNAMVGVLGLKAKEISYETLARKLLKVPPSDVPRMVAVDCEIENTELSHLLDLQSFGDRVAHVSDTYYGENRKEYVAPYVCLIQSSGMGKTKILHEYRKQTHDVNCKLILSGPVEGVKKPSIFDEILDLNVVIQSEKMAAAACLAIFNKFDELFLNDMETDDTQKLPVVVPLFDEAQFFLKEKLFDYDVFYFRVVRLWLRKVRPADIRVVAVFTGTNVKLRNFHFEADQGFVSKINSSREMQTEEIILWPKGTKSFLPFLQKTTIGCKLPSFVDDQGLTEYEIAVWHGRPLFAIMQDKGDLMRKGCLPFLVVSFLPTIGKIMKKHGSTSLEQLEQGCKWAKLLSR